MKDIKRLLWIFGIVAAVSIFTLDILWFWLPRVDFSKSATLCENQALLLKSAEACLGTMEGSETHHTIVDTYNAHEPLAQGYEVQYTDDWCATFVSFCAIETGLTDRIPTECGCQRQIGLWQQLDRWEEQDSYLPRTGDVIYYDWDVRTLGNSTGWSDHVGIVVGTYGPFIKVIEGNKDDSVSYRYIIRWDPRIRGYGLPDYQ